MEFKLTGKGRRYLEKIPSEVESKVGDYDFIILKAVDEDILEDIEESSIERQIGTKGKMVLRRLFEEGYLEYTEDTEVPLICAWCKKDMGTTTGKITSHTLCEECDEKVLR